MSYVVLARKWRPMRFEDLVGQDHVARTLGNAIDAKRVAHAFLFTGVRGVGKTTSARILAKALNCMREPGSRKEGDPDPGPTVTPCLKCSACLEITEGTDLDVREIDGASYNGVDEVRKLQDSLPYRPSRDRYKVIIVDEVHMLSTAAFNAFLKTLEEPPPHVKFIFATTEVHKVPITILSRIQRFDFKMIPAKLIVERLRYVLGEEKIEADETSLAILARQAGGSMRDAMSLLDQVIAFSGGNLTGEDVARVLGVASRGALMDIGRAVVGGDSDKCLSTVGALADQGFDIGHVARDVLGLLRDLVVAKVCKNPKDLLDLAEEERLEVLAIAREASENDLLRLHQAFAKSFDDVVRGADPRAGLEMLLVRLALRPPLLPIDELLHRIGNLEKRLLQGGAAPRPRGPRPGGSGGGSSSGGDPRPPADRPRDRSPRSVSQGAPIPSAGEEDSHRAPSPVPVTPPQAAVLTSDSTSVRPESAPSSVPEAVVSTASEPRRRPLARPSFDQPPPPPPAEEELSRLEELEKIIDRVRELDSETAAYFEQTVPLSIGEKALVLGLSKGHVFEQQLAHERAQAVVLRALRERWGNDATLTLKLSSEESTPARTLAAERVRKRKVRHFEAVQKVKNHPRVREVVELFDAHIKNVNVAEGMD